MSDPQQQECICEQTTPGVRRLNWQCPVHYKLSTGAVPSVSPAPQEQEWQPITTAPRDGSVIRLRWLGTTVEANGRLVKGNNLRYACDEWRDIAGDDVLTTPTHWKPPTHSAVSTPDLSRKDD